ncbi:MAG TPA: hypothetical protein VN605_10925 [Thermoanaerobaculia bacterium]|nr:hypothetical protein [Thermoanaerobaculia bacterium]
MLTLAVATGGATLDRAGFLYERPVPKAKGLVALQLDADVLARSSNSLADVRIVNGKNEQVPYILEGLPQPLALPLAVPPRAATEGTSSLYRIALPYESLPNGTAIVLTTDARVFSRRVVLRLPADEQHGLEARFVTELDWSGTNPDAAPAPVSFDLSRRATRTVELLVDEGDNAPLPIASAELRVPAAALRFYDPGTPLTLLYGNPQIGSPRYDLALLAQKIATEKAQTLKLDSAPVRVAPAAREDSKKWFWAALLVAVGALLALLARLISARPA